MFGSLRSDAVEFQTKVEAETDNRKLVSLAREVRSLVHDVRIEEAKKVLDEFERAIPEDDDAYYFRKLVGDMRFVLGNALSEN